MPDTAFQNVDDSAIEAARNAELEAYRQRLIAYDTDPQPRSPDLTELADVDANDDGYTWNSATGRWESEESGGGTSDPITPSLIYPVEHEDAVWFWWSNSEDTAFAHSNESSGSDTYVDGVITSPTNGVLPVDTEDWSIPNSFLVGNPTEASVGDRIIYLDEWWNAHFGIFVVVDTGSETTPWVIERAADHQVDDLTIPFAVKSPYGRVRSRKLATSESNMLNSLSIEAYTGTALSPHAAATAGGSHVLGEASRTEAVNSVIIGNDNFLDDTAYGSIVIGDNISSATAGVIIIGSNQGAHHTGAIVTDKAVGEVNPDSIDAGVGTYTIDGLLGTIFYVQILPVELYSSVAIEVPNVQPGRKIYVEFETFAATDATITWPEDWVWPSAMPTQFFETGRGLLTVFVGNVATWATFDGTGVIS